MQHRPLTRNEVAAIARGAVHDELRRLVEDARDLRRFACELEDALIERRVLDERVRER